METIDKKTAHNYLVGFAGVAIGVILSSMIIGLLIYRAYVGNELSTKSSEWADFGSFFSGFLTPIISLATFVALLITIWLQRSLINQQDKQIQILEGASSAEKVSAHKQILLNQLHQEIATKTSAAELYSSNLVALSERVEKAFDNFRNIKESNDKDAIEHHMNLIKKHTETMEEQANAIISNRKLLDALLVFSRELSQKTFKKMSDLETYFSKTIKEMIEPLMSENGNQ